MIGAGHRGACAGQTGAGALPTLSEAESKALLARLRRARARRADGRRRRRRGRAPPTAHRLPGRGEAVRRRRSRTRPSGGSCASGCGDATRCAAAAAELLAAAPARGRRRRRCSSRRWSRGTRELIAGLVPRPAVRAMRDARCRRRARRGARATSPSGSLRSTRVDADEHDRRAATQALLGAVPRRAGGRPGARSPTCCSACRAVGGRRSDVASSTSTR